MSEQECTAIVNEGEAPPNLLFTPPCDCPRCAPDRIYDNSADEGWLRIRGQKQRYRVEVIDLGATGRAVLG
ncbi:MAG: hypothetical protein GY724_08500 [Actinomycetia bacterium]|nr:hypothetical protein [Actinomycetes bacterium]MCP4222259.1 hypothetical protein [Actinomycetes bacterium]MCP5033229.1 hypothetical protein [Actinomycetes bacterium]